MITVRNKFILRIFGFKTDEKPTYVRAMPWLWFAWLVRHKPKWFWRWRQKWKEYRSRYK